MLRQFTWLGQGHKSTSSRARIWNFKCEITSMLFSLLQAAWERNQGSEKGCFLISTEFFSLICTSHPCTGSFTACFRKASGFCILCQGMGRTDQIQNAELKLENDLWNKIFVPQISPTPLHRLQCKPMFFKIFIYFTFRGRGREGEKRERNINVWLPLLRTPMDTRPTTQAYSPTGNRTGDPLVCRTMLNPLRHTSQG